MRASSIRRRPGIDRGRRPRRLASWPFAASSFARRRARRRGRATCRPAGRDVELARDAILVAIGEEPDPSILPEGAGIEVSGWAGIVADPQTLATGRAGIFAGGDVVSGPRTIIEAVAAGRRAAASIHEYLAGARDGEAEILAAVRYRTAPEAPLSVDLVARPRIPAALPVVDSRSFSATAPGFTAPEAQPRRAGVSDAMPSGCPVRAGHRRPRDRRTGLERQTPTSHPVTAAGPADQPAQEVCSDARPGIRILRRRRGFIEGTIAAALVVLWVLSWRSTSPPVHGPQHRKFTLRLGADLWWIIFVALRDILLLQVFLGSSSSSTPTWSPGRTSRSPAGSRLSAPSPRCS